VNAIINAINQIMGSPYFQIDFNSGFEDDANKKPLDRPITPNEVIKQNKR